MITTITWSSEGPIARPRDRGDHGEQVTRSGGAGTLCLVTGDERGFVLRLSRDRTSLAAELPRTLVRKHAGRDLQRVPAAGCPVVEGEPGPPVRAGGDHLACLLRRPAHGRIGGLPVLGGQVFAV